MKRSLIAVGAVLLLSLTACASGGSVAESTPRPTSQAPYVTPTSGPVISTPGPTGTAADVPPAKWDAILADLAKRNVTGTAELVSSTEVTWNNGALGCPAPGQSYTQSLIEGLKIVVAVNGKSFDYRFGADDMPKLCTT